MPNFTLEQQNNFEFAINVFHINAYNDEQAWPKRNYRRRNFCFEEIKHGGQLRWKPWRSYKRTPTEEESSLLEIKNLLLVINHSLNCSISSILSENKALRKEIKELKVNINFNNSKLKDLKESLHRTNNENKGLKKSPNKQVKPNTKIEELPQVWDNLDNLEQKRHWNPRNSKICLPQYRRCGDQSSGSPQYYSWAWRKLTFYIN